MTPLAASSPDAERRLIGLSAGTRARRDAHAEEAHLLTRQVDWARLTDTLRARKLLPVLGGRILEFADGSASDDFSAAFEQALESGRRQGALLQLLALRIIAMLGDAGIRASPLKGPLMGEAIYGDLGRRLSGDIDLLVAPDQLRDAVEVVRGLGYDSPADHVDRSGLPLLHFALVHARGDLPPVELHWRIHWYETDFARDRLLPPSLDAAASWHPAPADSLAALLLFYARDGFIDLRLASDLGAWWDAFGSGLPTGAVDSLLGANPALERPLVAALEVARHTVGLPVEEIIEEMPELDLRERIAARLANPHPERSRSQMYADIGFIDGLLAPAGGFGAFVRRQILPPREVLDQHARHSARRRRRSALGRGAGVLGRYGLTLARLARTPESVG